MPYDSSLKNIVNHGQKLRVRDCFTSASAVPVFPILAVFARLTFFALLTLQRGKPLLLGACKAQLYRQPIG